MVLSLWPNRTSHKLDGFLFVPRTFNLIYARCIRTFHPKTALI